MVAYTHWRAPPTYDGIEIPVKQRSRVCGTGGGGDYRLATQKRGKPNEPNPSDFGRHAGRERAENSDQLTLSRRKRSFRVLTRPVVGVHVVRSTINAETGKTNCQPIVDVCKRSKVDKTSVYRP